MKIFEEENRELQKFTDQADAIAASLAGYGKDEDIAAINKLIANFRTKTADFYRENRKLNIGVVGQVKAGKSSFLNTLLFEGKEILPKASTPKTATLTKMEYAEENVIEIEYYSPEEWEVLEDNSVVDLDDEIYTSAREIVDMVRRNGVDPQPYLEKRVDRIQFAAYEDMISSLNDYVGEDGRYTPIVKAVTLYLNKEEFRGLSIVDTPGLNDPIASRTIRTKEFMEVCDVVFFLSQSGSFLDKSDWILLSSQLPQKGVKKLVLIASKYDSGVRDILRAQDDDDLFGDDENTADNIPKACKIIKRKLKKRAKTKVGEFIKDLEARGSSPQLIEVVKQCEAPIMVSSIAYNMAGKPQAEYSSEEKNIYSALKQFSSDMESDLELLGNFQEVRKLFDEAVAEKEAILESKARSFLPNAFEELKTLLAGYLEKTNKRIQILESNDRGQLLEQKKQIETQMGAIKADITTLFGDLNARLETEKSAGIREIREASKDYSSVKMHAGTRTVCDSYRVSDSKWWNPFSWGSSHMEYYTREEHYSYCLAADAVENLRKYAVDASNQVEEVFSEALNIKDIKRRLLNVVIQNFDVGSETYDSSFFRLMVEETVSGIQFPVFDMDISEAMNGIAGKFTGELTSTSQQTELSAALSKAISRIYEELSNRLDETVKNYKSEMTTIGHMVEEKLLGNITREFEALLSQCENKDQEIAGYRAYAAALDGELGKLNR